MNTIAMDRSKGKSSCRNRAPLNINIFSNAYTALTVRGFIHYFEFDQKVLIGCLDPWSQKLLEALAVVKISLLRFVIYHVGKHCIVPTGASPSFSHPCRKIKPVPFLNYTELTYKLLTDFTSLVCLWMQLKKKIDTFPFIFMKVKLQIDAVLPQDEWSIIPLTQVDLLLAPDNLTTGWGH